MFAIIIAFLSGMLVSLTVRLYSLSRNYRYVMRVLADENKALKRMKNDSQSMNKEFDEMDSASEISSYYSAQQSMRYSEVNDEYSDERCDIFIGTI